MKTIVSYKIIPVYRIILECLKGPVKPEEVVTLKLDEFADKNFDINYNVICDIREMNTILSKSKIDESKNLFEFFNNCGLISNNSSLKYSIKY
ncbi:hypothetical protein [Plebeiibacterium sediminum]|uniref:Uncharacterized protein n=1 Tax=Plebeiibacterium sediminum TaxID=2992112 RepID=A0AAE3SIG6_9BACT|nr:hypothetical protein [Plebeiobacterium sediminum]MCW3789213.1 hypothetical protein [Plebeiobacterium sediminum]